MHQENLLTDIVEVKKRRWFTDQPFNWFLFLWLLLPIVPLFCWGQGLWIAFDKPRFFVTSDLFVSMLSFVFLIYWGIYNVGKKMLLSSHLIRVHFGITAIAVVYFLITSIWYPKMLEPSEMKAYFLEQTLINRTRELQAFSWKGILFLAAQLCLVVNLIGGIVRNRKTSS